MCEWRGPLPTNGASSPSMICLLAACRGTPVRPRAQRPPAPDPPRRLLGGPRRSPAGRPLPRGRQGLRSDRTPEPPLGGGAVGLHGVGPPLPRGHGARPAPYVHPGLRIHRTARLDLDDTIRHQGIPVTTPARTLLDLAAPSTTARSAPPPAAPSRSTASTCASSPTPWRATGADAAPPGSPRSSPPARRRPSSELEDVVLDLILRGGHVHPDVNVPYYVEGRRTSPISAGPTSAWSSRPTAPRGTTTSSHARMTPSARRSSRLTASGSCGSPGRRRSPGRARRSPGCARRVRPTLIGR